MFSARLRVALVLPPVAPVMLALGASVLKLAGHRFNAHGDLIPLLLVFGSMAVLACAVEIPSLVIAIRTLLVNAEDRTLTNLVATGIGVAYVVVFAANAMLVVSDSPRAQ